MVLLFGLHTMPAFGQIGYMSDNEKEDVMYMLEEEKLARDVYLTLGEKWDSQVFQNIAAS